MGHGEREFQRNPVELALESEESRYESARAETESALSELLDGAILDPEDEKAFLMEQAALLHADIGAVIADLPDADAAALGRKLQMFARQLYIRKHPDTVGLRKQSEEMRAEVEDVRRRLLELRSARRSRIVELQDRIDRLLDDGGRDWAVSECCALLEEEIGSLRAQGDEHMASKVSANLENVRSQGILKKERIEKLVADEDEREWAHSIVAGLVIMGRVATGDESFAEREATEYIVKHRGETSNDESVIDHVLSVLRERNRGVSRTVVDVDPREAFVSGVQSRT